jgi:hypothetical protein
MFRVALAIDGASRVSGQGRNMPFCGRPGPELDCRDWRCSGAQRTRPIFAEHGGTSRKWYEADDTMDDGG